jgi:hypothetical protein
MSALFNLIKTVVVLTALAAGAVAIWRRKDQLKQLWASLGGTEGVVVTTSRLVESAGPVRDLVNQFANLKK